MNLPHGELLVFAKEVVLKTDNKVQVSCRFPTVPTLSMFIEAAAQCSAAFNVDNEPKIGFLTMATNVEFLDEVDSLEYIFIVFSEAEVGAYKKFFFEAIDKVSKISVVRGNFTLVVETN